MRGLRFALVMVASFGAHAQPSSDIERLERDLAVLRGDLERLEAANDVVPELFSVSDRDERATWGAIFHLNKEYARAALALFGAIEPRPGQTGPSVEDVESLYLLGDSLYELGNYGAARVYLERVLELRGHAFADDAIVKLMALAAAQSRFDDVDAHYDAYLRVAGTRVPPQVRYLRATSLFRRDRDAEAVAEVTAIPSGDAFDLRARYLRVAVLTRQNKLTEALVVVDDALKQRAVSSVDGAVLELCQLARARLLYELDRLDEAIDAYQEIGLESSHLTAMLYEVTLTYVRRGQLVGRVVDGDGLSDNDRRERAAVEYKKALRQLEDLRVLESDSERRVDIDLLSATLTLQLRDFDVAHELFADVASRYRAADAELERLAGDLSARDQILRDILALEVDARAQLDSPIPAVAARRAARNKEVARSLLVFKELQRTRAEVDEADRLLTQLEAMLSPDNPARTELFGALKAPVERSTSIANALGALRRRAVAAERAVAKPSPDVRARLEAISGERVDLERRLATVPVTAEAIQARRARQLAGLEAAERSLHELELLNNRLRTEATATAWLAERELGAAPAKREAVRQSARQVAAELARSEEQLRSLGALVDEMRRAARVAGGQGSGEAQLRARVDVLLDEERALLREGRATSPGLDRIDRVVEVANALMERNAAFRSRLDAAVEERVGTARATLAREREAMTGYRAALASVDERAADLRTASTTVALERVRREVSQIVLRGDVGVIDTAFARKQAETEKIGALQRSRALELTDLTQAYADLTRDELP